MISLFRTLLILIGLYVVVKFFMNLMSPSSDNKSSNPSGKAASSSKKENKNSDNQEGDYVDYEEIKD